MKKIVLLISIFFVNIVNMFAQYKSDALHVWSIVKADLERTQSVYISDSSIYCQIFSYMADSSKLQLANECKTYLLDYGNRNLIKKYAQYYEIPWQKYPLFQTLATDTIRPNSKFPLWVNAMLGDSITLNLLISEFSTSTDFSKKMNFLDCLLRRNDINVLSMLIKEYEKNIYYYDRHNYACYSSKFFLVYWLRHIFNENPLFCRLYKENIQNTNVHYITTNNTDDIPDVITNNSSVFDFINDNGNDNHNEYLKMVELFVNETYGVHINSDDVKLIWFYYVTERE